MHAKDHLALWPFGILTSAAATRGASGHVTQDNFLFN